MIHIVGSADEPFQRQGRKEIHMKVFNTYQICLNLSQVAIWDGQTYDITNGNPWNRLNQRYFSLFQDKKGN